VGIIGREQLSDMKRTSVLVNVARGDLVNQKALYERLVANPSFRYATDVSWFKQGREALATDFPIARLPNFVGTPHMSGPTGIASGRPAKFGVKNTVRYLRGLPPKNVVDRSEYASS
jgi:phosphoglycerate dehydrogenase-like enzyme